MLCRKCGQDKDLAAFRTRNGRPMMPCKTCCLEYSRRHYRSHKQDYVDRAERRNVVIEKDLREYIWNYLREHPCVDCGNPDPRVLEFDHVRGEKRYNVSDLRRLRFSWPVILAEIEKCDVRCANCHRIKTYHQLDWNVPDLAP